MLYQKDTDTEHYDHTMHSDKTICDPYSKSKILAEEAAWAFQKSLPEEEFFPIVTIHPGAIVGPTFTKGPGQSIDSHKNKIFI